MMSFLLWALKSWGENSEFSGGGGSSNDDLASMSSFVAIYLTNHQASWWRYTPLTTMWMTPFLLSRNTPGKWSGLFFLLLFEFVCACVLWLFSIIVARCACCFVLSCVILSSLLLCCVVVSCLFCLALPCLVLSRWLTYFVAIDDRNEKTPMKMDLDAICESLQDRSLRELLQEGK